MTEAADVVALLRAALGDRVDTTEAARHEARADKSGHAASGIPLAVVRAPSVADVQATLRIATETRTPVVARGAGTGLAGGANAGEGEIALSVRGMDRILEVRPDDLLAVVEPGILNGDLNTALAEYGLWWAPDPASRAISTVGGNIATGAGGLLCAKYGVVRDAVLGVDLVLADGRLLQLGHRTVKGVTGLDLTVTRHRVRGHARRRRRRDPEAPPARPRRRCARSRRPSPTCGRLPRHPPPSRRPASSRRSWS